MMGPATAVTVRRMWLLRQCNHCGGDLYLAEDGTWPCLQCNRPHVWDVDGVQEITPLQVEEKKQSGNGNGKD